MTTIPQLIKKARQESALTQGKLGSLIGGSKSYVSMIESGKQYISNDKATEILSALGYDLTVEYSITKKSSNAALL